MTEKVCPLIAGISPRNFEKIWRSPAWTRNSWLGQLLSDSTPEQIVGASIVDLWNHMDSGRSIVASLEWTHTRVLHARRSVEHFATACNGAASLTRDCRLGRFRYSRRCI